MFTYTFGKRANPCDDCCDGYCTMNCGPKIEGKMAISDLPFYEKPSIDDLMPAILREARADRDEIKTLRAAIGIVRQAASEPDGSYFHDNIWKAVQKMLALADGDETAHVDIVFDGPPSPDGPRFVEVENASGKSFRLGQWVQRSDGTFALRFTAADLP